MRVWKQFGDLEAKRVRCLQANGVWVSERSLGTERRLNVVCGRYLQADGGWG